MRILVKLVNWLKFIVTPNIYPERWQDRVFRGNVSLGPITVYGANAMHWAINIQFRGKYWCFHPRTRTFGGYWPWYFYVSYDATPQGATFRRGYCFAD